MAEIFYPVGDGTYERLLRVMLRYTIRCECRAWAVWLWLERPYCDSCLPFKVSESQRSYWERSP